ncbi:hypothetical protein M0804_011066 [Polistes exclamans]|nr:hypothetical protein M0804_011066 [Polistes exclamans]
MDLLCCERSTDTECRAYADPALVQDDRVLHNLLKTEETYVPNRSYFECVQKDISPHMRKVVAEWISTKVNKKVDGDNINGESLEHDTGDHEHHHDHHHHHYHNHNHSNRLDHHHS